MIRRLPSSKSSLFQNAQQAKKIERGILDLHIGELPIIIEHDMFSRYSGIHVCGLWLMSFRGYIFDIPKCQLQDHCILFLQKSLVQHMEDFHTMILSAHHL